MTCAVGCDPATAVHWEERSLDRRNELTQYNPSLFSSAKPSNLHRDVIFTMTTCKRYDLATDTLNSFFNMCSDWWVIKDWYIFDDNSDPKDIARLKFCYPFINIVSLSGCKGHPANLNSMITTLKQNPCSWVFHLEDDWLTTKPFSIEHMIYMANKAGIDQLHVNRHYAEDSTHSQQQHFKQRFSSSDPGHPDVLSHSQSNSNDPIEWATTWPGFSFRPALTKSVIWTDTYVENCGDFERKLSTQLNKKNCVVGWLDDIIQLHIGAKNRDDHSLIPNAYSLNKESQYGNPPKAVPTEQNIPTVVTFTTCKRLNIFKNCLQSFVNRMSSKVDYTIVVVDDSSSATDRKTMEDWQIVGSFLVHQSKSHQASLNFLWDYVKKITGAKWWISSEDDWFWTRRIDMKSLIRQYEHSCVHQIVFQTHSESSKGFSHHRFDTRKRPPSCMDDAYASSALNYDCVVDGCWWPSLSLQPSLMKIQTVMWSPPWHLFKDPTDFEYRISMEMYKLGFSIATYDAGVRHCDGPSAYLINDTHRSFELVSCPNHRPTGFDYRCEHCIMHRDWSLKQ